MVETHRALEAELGHFSPPALLTDQLVGKDGKPVDVYRYFGVNPGTLHTMLGNFTGLENSAQVCSDSVYIEAPVPPWKGFEDVWIPISPELSLSGRLAFARDGKGIRETVCVVIMPGFFGDNGVLRTRDLALGLLDAGYHVLAVEMRGHGQTERRYPETYYRFGTRETVDLMQVSEWLERQPHVVSTGLIGFCWGANQALLCAWFDGRHADQPPISPALAAHLPPPYTDRPNAPPHFRAGVMAFSPSVKWEEILDQCDEPHATLGDPVLTSLQNTIERRMRRKNHPNPSGSLRRLIEAEFARTDTPTLDDVNDAYDFLRLLPYKGKPAGDKLRQARVPTLIIHAANDPMNPAQDVAELIAVTPNPCVAAIMLPGGGHIGFAAFCRRYYYNLIVSFFDPRCGAAASMGSAALEPGATARNGSPQATTRGEAAR